MLTPHGVGRLNTEIPRWLDAALRVQYFDRPECPDGHAECRWSAVESWSLTGRSCSAVSSRSAIAGRFRTVTGAALA